MILVFSLFIIISLTFICLIYRPLRVRLFLNSIIKWIKIKHIKQLPVVNYDSIRDRFLIFEDLGYKVQYKRIKSIGNIKLKDDGIAVIIKSEKYFNQIPEWAKTSYYHKKEINIWDNLNVTKQWLKKSGWVTDDIRTLNEKATIRKYNHYYPTEKKEFNYPIFLFYNKKDKDNVRLCFGKYVYVSNIDINEIDGTENSTNNFIQEDPWEHQ